MITYTDPPMRLLSPINENLVEILPGSDQIFLAMPLYGAMKMYETNAGNRVWWYGSPVRMHIQMFLHWIASICSLDDHFVLDGQREGLFYRVQLSKQLHMKSLADMTGIDYDEIVRELRAYAVFPNIRLMGVKASPDLEEKNA